MINKEKRKRRIRKSIKRREKDRIKRAWRNLFIKSGVLNG